jgi:hypothetical protein
MNKWIYTNIKKILVEILLVYQISKTNLAATAADVTENITDVKFS